MKWGMFICWSFSTFYGQEWTPTQDKDASFFKATGCDTDQWCQTAKDAGMGYILFLTKHHDGFCLWDTKTTEKKVTNSPLGIDVLAKLRKSCDKHGIKLALYFSEGDWNWPGAVDGKGGNGGSESRVKKAQLKELLTQYGPIEFWWMDHADRHRRAVARGDGRVDAPVPARTPSSASTTANRPAASACANGAGPASSATPGRTKYNKDAEASFKGYLVAEFTYPILPKHKGGAHVVLLAAQARQSLPPGRQGLQGLPGRDEVRQYLLDQRRPELRGQDPRHRRQDPQAGRER